ncbi:hypothetical protein SAMN05428988_4381 [Chitinophaga sp. YR573]|uniref:hypothetical protein n=1 Tax=Chitinophaga sp. YR573 TaxID=1881040 RepID=UPI0008B9FCC9|nr:hypothetical protein [Chitinophaga sp. YR573]SEW35724.1 hypothetical protein SAMN05428988_4381 [Chitinophaga sp. YR573]
MNSISLIFSAIVLLAISWVLGSVTVDKVVPYNRPDLKENPMVILLIGTMVLAVLCLFCKI